MLRLLGLVISIGLADSMNPSTIAPGLYLASGRCPRRDVLQFTLGVFGIYMLGGILLVLGPGEALLALLPHPSATTRYILETIAGVVVLVGAGIVWFARERLGRRRTKAADSGRLAGRYRSPAVLGVTITIVELPTAFPYFAVIAAIVGSGVGLVQRILALVIYNVCFVLPLLGILVMLAVAPGHADEILGRVRKYIRRRWPVLLAGVGLVAGLFVLALGITGLVGEGSGPAASFSRGVRHVISH